MEHEILKLTLLGHVHGRPDSKITSYYSWPAGGTDNEIKEIIRQFTTAFTPLEFKAYDNNHTEATWLFNDQGEFTYSVKYLN